MDKDTTRRVRQRQEEADQGRDLGHDQRMTDLEEKMEQMSANVGTGTYQQPILIALEQSVTTNAKDVANLRAATTRNYEVPHDSNYIKFPKECMKTFGEHCKKMKGKEGNTGHPKNYAIIGLVEALLKDKDATVEEQEIATKLVRSKVLNSDDEINLNHAKEVQQVVSFCQVVMTPKKGYINIAFHPGPENELLMNAFDRLLRIIGKRQWDPPPPKPVNKDIRKWTADQRDKM